MTNLDALIFGNMISKIKSDDRKLPVKLSLALNRNEARLKNDVIGPFARVLEDRGWGKVNLYTMEGLADEGEKEELAQLCAAEANIELATVEEEDILAADLTINEVSAIMAYMLDSKEVQNG